MLIISIILLKYGKVISIRLISKIVYGMSTPRNVLRNARAPINFYNKIKAV